MRLIKQIVEILTSCFKRGNEKNSLVTQNSSNIASYNPEVMQNNSNTLYNTLVKWNNSNIAYNSLVTLTIQTIHMFFCNPEQFKHNIIIILK